MQKVLSIVVPAYNVERYLEYTLESFFNKEIVKDIEVIVVDDGSKDKTREIGEKYQKRYPDVVKLISKENGGHGSTINKGIKIAKGKYFRVVDGDDWLNTAALDVYVKKLQESTADYVVTDVCSVHEVTGEKKVDVFPQLKQKEVWEFQEISDKVQLPMHALTIKTEILQQNQIRLDEKCFYVDVEYILFPIPYINTVQYIQETIYMYRIGQATQSVSRLGSQRHIDDYVKVSLHLAGFLRDYKKGSTARFKERYIEKRIVQMVEDTMTVFYSFPMFNKDICKKLKNYLDEVREQNEDIFLLVEKKDKNIKRLYDSDFRAYTKIVFTNRIKERIEWCRRKKVSGIITYIWSNVRK